LWNSNESFSKVFEIEDISIWPIIDEILLKTFKQRIREYLNLILFSNKIQREINPKCIISVNVFGETEKAILESNSRTSSILLEHAFTNYVNELSLYDISNMYPIFKDKIALWGQIQKNYLVKYHQVPDDRIILSGSPRHDMFFQNKSTTYPSKKPRILITLGMLDEQNAIFTTELFERFEHVLEKTFLTLKETNDSSFVVKLHPSLQKNNLQIKKFIEEFDQNIIIKQFSSIVDDIRECDIIINIFTEIYGSTVMLEGLIMEKPILNISLDTRSYKFEFENDNAVLGISYNDDIDLNIKKIINDKELRSTLVKNGTKHVLRYLSNPGNASKELARILSSF
jgi:spore coat polysaccharide biosynthesis predicted glycosyltransferase SpsG